MLYRKEDLLRLRKKNRILILLNVIFLLSAAAVFTVTAFFVSDETILSIRIADSACLFLSFSFLVYTLLNVVAVNSRRIRFSRTLMKGEEKEYRGTVLSVKGPFTVSYSLKAYHIELDSGDGKTSVLKLDAAFSPLLPDEGEHVAFRTVNNFITEVCDQ